MTTDQMLTAATTYGTRQKQLRPWVADATKSLAQSGIGYLADAVAEFEATHDPLTKLTMEQRWEDNGDENTFSFTGDAADDREALRFTVTMPDPNLAEWDAPTFFDLTNGEPEEWSNGREWSMNLDWVRSLPRGPVKTACATLDDDTLAGVARAVKDAADAADGDSNDTEIDSLREALDAVIGLLPVSVRKELAASVPDGGDYFPIPK